MILDKTQSKRKLHLCDNKSCATPGAMDLPNGNPNAERVIASKQKNGAIKYSVACPWLLTDIFHL